MCTFLTGRVLPVLDCSFNIHKVENSRRFESGALSKWGLGRGKIKHSKQPQSTHFKPPIFSIETELCSLKFSCNSEKSPGGDPTKGSATAIDGVHHWVGVLSSNMDSCPIHHPLTRLCCDEKRNRDLKYKHLSQLLKTSSRPVPGYRQESPHKKLLLLHFHFIHNMCRVLVSPQTKTVQ